jgi:hypothetical protein
MKKRDVFTILDDLGSGLEELKESLQRLGTVFGKESAAVARRARKNFPRLQSKVEKKVARQLSASVKRLRAMQGRYMSLLRRLSKAQQSRAKKIRKSEGYAAALKFLSSLKAAARK